MKRNKIRYKANPVVIIPITITGVCYLMFRDDDEALQSKKGDFLVYPHNDALHTTRQGDYESTGFSGYFKVDVNDGKTWQPVIITDIFPHREHHFSKSECPIDTYHLVEEILKGWEGKTLRRTYREHYEPYEG